MWWNDVVGGAVLMAFGMVMAFARSIPGPPRLWGYRATFTGETPLSARVSGAATTAVGAGMVVLAFVPAAPPPAAVAVGVVAYAFLAWSCLLSMRAARLRRAYR